MQVDEITFSLLMHDWFSANVIDFTIPNPNPELVAEAPGRRLKIPGALPNDTVGINCCCHYLHTSGRWLGVIIDDTTPLGSQPHIRLFPLSADEAGSPHDYDTWTFLYPADPDFFTKLITSLNEVHVKRYGTEVVRSHPGLGPTK